MRNHRKNNVQTQDCPSQPSIIYVRPLYLYLCTTATDTSKLNYHAMRNRSKNYVQTQDCPSQPFIYVPLYLNLYTIDTDTSKLKCQAMRNHRKNYIQTQDCPSPPSIYIPLHLNLCTHDIHPISFPFPSYTQLPIQVHHRPTTQELRRLFLNPSQLLPHIFLHIITPNLPKVIVAIQHIVHHHCLAPPPQIQPLNYIPPLPTADVVNLQAPVLEFESGPAFFDESKIIKKKPEEIEPYQDGRCIYLVGMMGSGKTTVGKVLSEFLGHTFVDCDTLIEEAVGGSTVAEIFNLYGESFFRDNETEILQKLSLMHRLVVATGGGAVVRPINWRHMRKGISVWLDVPVEALARRITAVGTDSRPLLHHGHGNPYTETMKRLSTLLEERGEAYANADVRVSLESMATKLGFEDAGNISPTVIAIEVLLQIENFLKK